MRLLLLSVVCFCVNLSESDKSTPITISTKKGDVTGYICKCGGRQVNTFLGIPFAQPPVGNLRFAKPVEPKAWTGKPLVVQTAKSACVQPTKPHVNLNGLSLSEDCLHLNVWAPNS